MTSVWSPVDSDAPVDLLTHHDALVAHLRAYADGRATTGLPTITVCDGFVDDAELAFDHSEGRPRVLPYVVVWADAGIPLPTTERPVTWANTTGVVWSPILTVAAGHPGWVLGAIDLLRVALAGLVLPDGNQLVEAEDGARTVRRDPDADSDTRFFTPIHLRALLG